MSSSQITLLIKESVELEEVLWKIAGERIALGLIRTIEPYCYMRTKKIKRWFAKGKIISSSEKKEFGLNNEVGVLLNGEAVISGSTKKIRAPKVLNISKFSLANDAKVFICPKEEN